jgi:serine/threonine protein kinase
MDSGLTNFILTGSIDCGQDGFPGTYIEFGNWHEKNVAIKHGVNCLHEQEARILTRIGYHPNINQLLKDYEPGDDFIVLEAVGTGLTLEKVIEKNVQVSLDTCIDWLLQIAKGLKYIHEKGIIHHDIKSANILVNEERNVLKICDFELAVESPFGLKYQGTARWMAPEVKYDSWMGAEITNKIDIYGFGLIFLDLIFCGRDSNVVKYLCPIKLFALMYQCIHQDAAQRPSIDKIIDILSLFPNIGPSKRDEFHLLNNRLNELSNIIDVDEETKMEIDGLKTELEDCLKAYLNDDFIRVKNWSF